MIEQTRRLNDAEPQGAEVEEEYIAARGHLEAAPAEEYDPKRGHLEQIPEKWRTSQPVVRAVGLTKRYLGTTVLNDVALTLNEGEIFGLVGPNGAGKTTLLRILATLTAPDSGEALICGHPLSDVKAVRGLIGFMPDVLGVYEDMLVREYLEFFARAHHLPDATREYSIQETLTTVGLEPLAEQPVDGLSRGMKQRLGLGRAILHGPRLLLLDEPASGLDPLARLELREILRRMQRKGVTVLISSHVLEDLADMCTRIGVISRGTLMCVEETHKLIQERGSRRMRLRACQDAEELYEFLRSRQGVQGLRWDNDCVVFRMEGAQDADLAGLLADVVRAGIPLVQFGEEESTLESAYLNVTGAGQGWEATS
jgi:ABC-2 type transport system ATP-binding protein